MGPLFSEGHSKADVSLLPLLAYGLDQGPRLHTTPLKGEGFWAGTPGAPPHLPAFHQVKPDPLNRAPWGFAFVRGMPALLWALALGYNRELMAVAPTLRLTF